MTNLLIYDHTICFEFAPSRDKGVADSILSPNFSCLGPKLMLDKTSGFRIRFGEGMPTNSQSCPPKVRESINVNS